MKFSTVGTLAIGTFAMVAAGQPAKAAQSHLMQSPERHVVLQSVVFEDRSDVNPCGDDWDMELAEILPTGVAAETPFTVPQGFVLVVTDIDWNVKELSSTSFIASDVLRFSISLGKNGMNRNNPVFSDGQLIGDHAEGGVMLGGRSLTTGFRVAAGTPICPFAVGMDKEGATRLDVFRLILRGYLIQDSGRSVGR